MTKKISIIICSFLFTTLCNVNYLAGEPSLKDKKDFAEIQKIDMANLKDKMNYLIKKLKVNKKYYFKDQKIFLEHIIIGRWANPPHVNYEFLNDHVYFMNIYSMGKTIKGNWKINSDELELSSNGSIKKVKIISFCLNLDPEEKNRYYFGIELSDPVFLLTLDTKSINILQERSHK
jgi:hypothetical protein